MLKEIRSNLGDTLADLWLPISFILTYALWLLDWYQKGEFKTLSDFIAGLVLAVIASAFTFWVTAIGLLLLMVPVMIVRYIIRRSRSGK